MGIMRIVIVDDHTVVRDALRTTLDAEDDINVVGEAGDGKQGVQKAQELNPDLVLMDIAMPGMNGIDACHEIRDLLPDTKVLMLTASQDEESWTASMLAGAQGYVLKVSGQEEILHAIREVGRGNSIWDPRVLAEMIERFRRLIEIESLREVEQLTPREKEVLVLVARGATNKEIGTRLGISPLTARNTVSNILGKLGCENRYQLMRWALDHRLMEDLEGEL